VLLPSMPAKKKNVSTSDDEAPAAPKRSAMPMAAALKRELMVLFMISTPTSMPKYMLLK